jgi:L-ascorbate metabolism protein UlaG (beta-lactamase superfamily)
MPKYIGKTIGIDWDSIVDICKNNNHGDHNTVTSVVNRSEANAEGPLLKSYREIISTWEKAGYDLNQIEWWDYYPGEHFDISVQDKFAEIINAHPRRVFVSKLFPGRNVPYHWDVEDKEEEWLLDGELKRWVCFIDKPRWGSVLILEDKEFHNVEQGTILEWDNYRSHHAGTVVGTDAQYLFHFLGTPL